MSAYQQYEKCQSSNGCTRYYWGDCIDNIFVEIKDFNNKDFNNAVFPVCEVIGVFNPFQQVDCYRIEKTIVFKKTDDGFLITMPHNDGVIWENNFTFSIDGKD